MLLGSSAQAARLIQASLQSNASGSQLILSLDSKADYSLDLLDPQTVVLRLPKTFAAAIMPRTASDPIIENITVNSNSQGLDIIIRTRSAGATVQPNYSAADHKLTLSFGGDSRGNNAAPAASPTGAPPQIASLIVEGGNGKIIMRLSADKPVKGQVSSQGDIVFLRLEKGAMAPGMQIVANDSRVLAMQVENTNPFAVVCKLSRPLGSYNMTAQDNGLLIELSLGETKVMPAPSAPQASPPQPARPSTVSVPQPDISTSKPPEGPLPVEQQSAPAETAAGALTQAGAPQILALAPSQAAQVRGSSARGTLPPLPPEAQQGGVSVEPDVANDDGPPVTVTTRQPQGASLAGRGPATPVADLSVAGQLMEEGRYDEALYSYELVLKENPGYQQSAEATYGLAEAYFRLHQEDIVPYYTRIIDLYQKAMVNYPDSEQIPRAMLMMGRAASLAEDHHIANAYYKLVSSRYRRSEYSGRAQIYLAQNELAKGNYKEAMDLFSDVMNRWPEGELHSEAEMGMLQGYFGLQQWEEAANTIAGILQREPDIYLRYPQVLQHMGEALYQFGDYPLAREYMMWALNINPRIKEGDIVMSRIGDCYRQEKAYRAATEIYNETTMMFPNSPGSQLAKIRLSEEPEEDREHPWEIFQVRPSGAAMRTYTDIAQLYGDKAVGQLAKLKMAVWYYKTAAFAYSLQTGMELLEKHPDTIFRPEVDYLMDVAARARLHELKEESNSEQLLSGYLRLRPYLKEPENNDILDMLAWGYEHSGLNDKAAHLYKVLGSRLLNKPEYWVDAARNYFVDEKYQQALDTLHEVNLDELNANKQKEFLFLEGLSLSSQNKYKEAVLALLALLKKEPLENPGQVYQHLGFALAHLDGRAQDALNALDLAEKAYAGEADNKQNSSRLLVALQAGVLSKQTGDAARALPYLQKALSLSQNNQDKAPILYQIYLTQRGMGQQQQMQASLKQLAEMQVSPWSGMAESALEDIKLAPNLERRGRDWQQGAQPPGN